MMPSQSACRVATVSLSPKNVYQGQQFESSVTCRHVVKVECHVNSMHYALCVRKHCHHNFKLTAAAFVKVSRHG